MKGLKDKTGRFVKNLKDKTCTYCSKTFSPSADRKKYCSRKCSELVRIKDRTRNCIECNIPFNKLGTTKFCTHKCYAKSMVGKRTKTVYKTSINKLFRSSPNYKNWVKQCLIRDDYTCQFCNKRGQQFHIDHIIAFASIMNKIRFEKGIDDLYNKAMSYELLWDTNNGRTLCVPCHKTTDSYLNSGVKNVI